MPGTMLDARSEKDKETIQVCVRFITSCKSWLETNNGKVDGWVWCSANGRGKLLLPLTGQVKFFH